ncbi:MAG TPA: hypothetical protein VLF95_04080, partial [Vicinamibacteria bacterium]|nr:hypothetical protein [Vicinamibacteria bacterium]
MHLLPFGLPAWLLFVGVAILLPGLALQRLARTPPDPALVVPLGTAWCAGSYWLSLAADQAWLFPVAQALLAGALLLRLGPWRRADSPSLRGA